MRTACWRPTLARRWWTSGRIIERQSAGQRDQVLSTCSRSFSAPATDLLQVARSINGLFQWNGTVVSLRVYCWRRDDRCCQYACSGRSPPCPKTTALPRELADLLRVWLALHFAGGGVGDRDIATPANVVGLGLPPSAARFYQLPQPEPGAARSETSAKVARRSSTGLYAFHA